MFFDDPKNALSVARTHQRELLQAEQRDRLARQAELDPSGLSDHELRSWRQPLRAAVQWLKTRVARRAAEPARGNPYL
jgi:hypothetical protein